MKEALWSMRYRKSGGNSIYYTRKLSGFVQVLDFIPAIYDSRGNLRKPSELKELVFILPSELRDVFLALLNSSLFFWYPYDLSMIAEI